MRIDETNTFFIPLADDARAAFNEKLEETAEGRACLLLEWANGDNLMVNDSTGGLLEFAFYSGETHIWIISQLHARELADSMVSDRSHNCEIIKAQCSACARADGGRAVGQVRRGGVLKCA